MKILVIYESMYGNTRLIAEAVASGLDGPERVVVRAAHSVTAAEVANARLVVVGAPTHAWGMPRARTRQGAVDEAKRRPGRLLEPDVTETGVREWLLSLAPQPGKLAAVFDTRLDKPKLITGAASRPIERRLKRLGFRIMDAPMSFTVETSAGPLTARELHRAHEWGEVLSVTLGRQPVPVTASSRQKGADR